LDNTRPAIVPANISDANPVADSQPWSGLDIDMTDPVVMAALGVPAPSLATMHTPSLSHDMRTQVNIGIKHRCSDDIYTHIFALCMHIMLQHAHTHADRVALFGCREINLRMEAMQLMHPTPAANMDTLGNLLQR
jgi:hypothetical protein